MRSLSFVCAMGVGLCIVPCAAVAQMIAIPGLFKTGSNGAGGIIADGAADLNYKIVSSTNPNYNGSPWGTAVNASAIPGDWVPNITSARWISDNATAATATGSVVTFRLTLDLTEFRPETASLTGEGAADDIASVLLNGTPIGTLPGFGQLATFSASSGFVRGINTLDFVVRDTAANVAGLLVSDIRGTAFFPTPGAASVIAAAGIVAAGRRRRGA
jgi:hypothetical protein